MKIKEMSVKNFKGISDRTITPDKNITVVTGPNGAGKSSLLEAVIYGLTGEHPQKAIRDGETTMQVLIKANDEVNWERIQTENKPNKFKLNGKASTAKVLSEQISKLSGLTDKALKITTSENVVRNLSSGDLGEFLMSYVPQDLTIQDIINYFPSEFQDMYAKDIEAAKETLKVNFEGLLEPYSLEDVKDVASALYDKRKYLNKMISDTESIIKSLPDSESKKSLDEVKQELEEIIKKEALYTQNKTAQDNYNQCVRNREKQYEQILALKKEIDAITVSKPDDNVIQTLTTEKENISNDIFTATNTLGFMQNALTATLKTLENLDKPFCPLSDKLTCTVDKTPLKNELEESKKLSESGIEEQKKLINSLNEKLKGKENEIKLFHENSAVWQRKMTLIQSYNSLAKSMPKLPEKPAEILQEDFSQRKSALYAEKDEIEKSNKKKELSKQLDNLKYETKIHDFLVKILGNKGCVMEKITSGYLSIFNDTCNDRANKLKPGFVMNFVAEDGIKILCRPSEEKPMLPFENLSDGEKACAIFLIMDLLNALTDLRILLFDGNSIGAMDEEVLTSFLNLLINSEIRNDYDHIIINMINNEKTIEYLKDKDIDLIEL